MRFVQVVSIILLTALVGCASTEAMQDPDPLEGSKAKARDDDAKAYSDVITDDFESDEGLFRVHRDGAKIMFEIPDSLLGKELLLVSRIAATADNVGYGGMKANTQVVRWVKQDEKILLRIASYQNVADEDEAIYQAVRSSNVEPIIMAFDVESQAEDSAGSVIDVSQLFMSDVPVLGLQKFRRDQYKVRRLNTDRSYVESVNSYPENIEVRHVLTYEATEPPSNSSTGTITIEMNQSMVLLPEEPMQPRLCDQRVGYFSVRMTDYSEDSQKAEPVCYITRWRLEPSDPDAYARGELVDPVKPIVYYIDPATPMKWRPYLKQGVEDWNAAFEAAGFKNAITAKDPPTKEEDPEFSPEDARYSVIRYFSSDIQNAFGPHVNDPRSGEILESDIGWYHNVMKLLRNWYFIQTSASNADARGVEFSDETMGDLIRFVSAHEVGHTIGLPHNWGSSYAYPVDSLRSPTFTSTHGTAPSIMDYARFNYIAQPGDGVTSYYPSVGEYDLWSIKWGYSYLADAADEEAERGTLNEWVKNHANDPAYFYGRATGARIDPRSQNEDLGNDAVLASTYGLMNLKRIVPELLDWSERSGENYDDLTELYGQVVGQWGRYVGHVARSVGGIYEEHKTYDQDGVVYTPVAAERQKSAMNWLHENGFSVPEWVMEKSVLDRIQHAGALETIRRTQVGSLNLILDPSRIARLIELEALAMDDTYTPLDMLEDLRDGIWSELGRSQSIHVVRRNLQNAYLDRMAYLMGDTASGNATPIQVSQSDIRALVRGELEALDVAVGRATRGNRDHMTRLHLREVQSRIDKILDNDE